MSSSQSEAAAIVAVDRDVDGQVELVTLESGRIVQWQADGDSWKRESLSGETDQLTRPMAIADVNGDGRQEIVVTTATGWTDSR